MKRSFLTRSLWLLVLAPALVGCSVITGAIQSAGNYIGERTGILPADETFDPAEQREQATQVITPEQEYFIGRAVAARLLERFKPVQNPELQGYLQLTGNALVASGEAGEMFGGYHFLVVESDQMNAISAPGGYIMVTTGFLNSLTAEDQLAAVLSHEIAHVSQRHGVRMMQSSAEYEQFSMTDLSTGSLNCTEALLQATALFSAMVDNLVETLLVAGYSQDLEFEADAFGYNLLTKTGYSPRGMTDVLHKLQQLESSTGASNGGWFNTHPSTDTRLSRIASLSSGEEGAVDAGSAARDARFAAATGK